MRLIERIDEAEVVAEFLRAEIDSPRFGARVRDFPEKSAVVVT